MALGQHEGQAWVKDASCWCPAGPTLALLDTRFQVQQGESTSWESICMVQTWTLARLLPIEETICLPYSPGLLCLFAQELTQGTCFW